eukprot:1712263-Amphidinium_carterae.2
MDRKNQTDSGGCGFPRSLVRGIGRGLCACASFAPRRVAAAQGSYQGPDQLHRAGISTCLCQGKGRQGGARSKGHPGTQMASAYLPGAPSSGASAADMDVEEEEPLEL